jgi:hypothetical protein
MDANTCYNLAAWLLALIVAGVLATATTYHAPNRRTDEPKKRG